MLEWDEECTGTGSPTLSFSIFGSIRSINTASAPMADKAASASRPIVKSPIASFRYPMAKGLAKPARLQVELIAAIPAAPEAPVRKLAYRPRLAT